MNVFEQNQAVNDIFLMEKELDRITRAISGFDSFEDLLNAKGGYRPTIMISRYPFVSDERFLADQYDIYQAERGDNRRVYRGTP